MGDLLGALLGYLINLASNERSTAIQQGRQDKLRKALQADDALKKALASKRSLREELKLAAIAVARNRDAYSFTRLEQPLVGLLTRDDFLDLLANWFMAGSLEEGKGLQAQLSTMVGQALRTAGQEEDQKVLNGFLESFERDVFSNPILANWRHQLTLNYLRRQVDELKRQAEAAAGIYAADVQARALNRYSDVALKVWDIIDLSNLPEGDTGIATQALLLRQLYVPLRVSVEARRGDKRAHERLAQAEQQRAEQRLRDAGRTAELEPDEDIRSRPRRPIGRRLAIARRLVVLGDPGAGKTTALRWIATALLLKHKGDPAFSKLPDVNTLPDVRWIPVLIRCRDLGEADLCRSFSDFLTEHLKKTELQEEEAKVMRAIILAGAAKGEILFLIDGLDEITNPKVRVLFCQELERAAARFPEAPFVVTSRIVGYRDMPYRMGQMFEHCVISDLSGSDKDHFAERWIEVTEQKQTRDERARRLVDLKEALHSSDRIERLTGNPMLLTTLALVKRKVGRLPNRRIDLYREAVSVLLNFNPIHAQIDEREAMPQLEYVAYEMCARGTQTLTEDEILDLLERVRVDYPNIRPVRARVPKEFLTLLEARSGIMIQAGGLWTKQDAGAVYEFRHLTFQEYLAARALIDGRYPGRDRTKNLAEQVAPLAATLERRKNTRRERENDELQVSETWRETLRLCVSGCSDDDVDQVITAIQAVEEGRPDGERRARAVLAASCLADEPNVSEDVADRILSGVVKHVAAQDGSGRVRTTLDQTLIELASSVWCELLLRKVTEEFIRRDGSNRSSVGGVAATILGNGRHKKAKDAAAVGALRNQYLRDIKSPDRCKAVLACLGFMELAFHGKLKTDQDVAQELLGILKEGTPERHAGAWALGWMAIPSAHAEDDARPNPPLWIASVEQVRALTEQLVATPEAEPDTRRWLLVSIKRSKEPKIAREAAAANLVHVNANLRAEAVDAIRAMKEPSVIPLLLPRLEDENERVRQQVVDALTEFKPNAQIEADILRRLPGTSGRTKAQFVRVLAAVGKESAVDRLIECLEDSDSSVQSAAAEGLGNWTTPAAIQALSRSVRSTNEDVRDASASALVNMKTPEAERVLEDLLNERSEPLRQLAMGAFAERLDEIDQLILARDTDGFEPWLVPGDRIDNARIEQVVEASDKPKEEILQRATKLAGRFRLKLST